MRTVEIDLAGVDLKKLLKEAYALSGNDGAELDDELAQELLDKYQGDFVVALEAIHVQGREVNLSVFRHKSGVHMFGPWYGHSEEQLIELCKRVKAKMKVVVGVAV